MKTDRYFRLALGAGLLCSFCLLAYTQPASKEAELANEYFNDGEYEKAADLYLKLTKNQENEDFYTFRVADCYLRLKDYDTGIDFATRLAKKNPTALQYQVLKGKFLQAKGQTESAEALWQEIITKKLKKELDFRAVGALFLQFRMFSWAETTFLQGRKTLKNQYFFARELANIYSESGDYEKSVIEWINVYLEKPVSYNEVKTVILSFSTPETADVIEAGLLRKSQSQQNDPNLRDLLFEFYIAAAKYDEALLQAKSLDKLNHEKGERLYRLAQVLQNNQEYERSNIALDYIITNHKDSPYYYLSYLEKAKNFDFKIFEEKKSDTVNVQAAIQNYDALFQQFGRRDNFFDAMYRKAYLAVFFLNELTVAAQELSEIEKLNIPANQKAKAKILYGDIFLLTADYNKARLTYSEVEDKFKEDQIGALAKLKFAQLSYYKGEFDLAKARLKSLKDNTSNDISNDAMRLYLLIQDNIGLDSTTTALEIFAKIQLLVYQKRLDTALVMLDTLVYRFPTHPLADEIIWERVNIYLAKNQIEKTLFWIDKLLDGHSDGIYADDALFKKAEIYQFVLNKPQDAQKMYLDLLVKYSGSLYRVEARKRIRKLRGEVAK